MSSQLVVYISRLSLRPPHPMAGVRYRNGPETQGLPIYTSEKNVPRVKAPRLRPVSFFTLWGERPTNGRLFHLPSAGLQEVVFLLSTDDLKNLALVNRPCRVLAQSVLFSYVNLGDNQDTLDIIEASQTRLPTLAKSVQILDIQRYSSNTDNRLDWSLPKAELIQILVERQAAYENVFIPAITQFVSRTTNLHTLFWDSDSISSNLAKLLLRMPLRRAHLTSFCIPRDVNLSSMAWKLEELYIKMQHSINAEPGNHICDTFLASTLAANLSTLTSLGIAMPITDDRPPMAWFRQSSFPWGRLRVFRLHDFDLSVDQLRSILPDNSSVTRLSCTPFRPSSQEAWSEWLCEAHSLPSLTHVAIGDKGRSAVPFFKANPQLQQIALRSDYPVPFILDTLLPCLASYHHALHTLCIHLEELPQIETSLHAFTLLRHSLRRLWLTAGPSWMELWVVSYQKLRNELRELQLLTDFAISCEQEPRQLTTSARRKKARAIVRMLGRTWPHLSFAHVASRSFLLTRHMKGDYLHIIPIMIGEGHWLNSFLDDYWGLYSDS